jgi:hypothetical protein
MTQNSVLHHLFVLRFGQTFVVFYVKHHEHLSAGGLIVNLFGELTSEGSSEMLRVFVRH